MIHIVSIIKQICKKGVARMKKSLLVLSLILILSISAISCSDNGIIERDDLDVDFHGLSATDTEALYHSINNNPADHMGQTIRAVGTYYPLLIPQSRSLYHYVVVVPGDECCQLLFEFKISGDNMDLSNIPKEGTRIEVTGVFSRYVEDGVSYIYLADSELNTIK